MVNRFFFHHLCLIDLGGVKPGEDNDYSSGDEGYIVNKIYLTTENKNYKISERTVNSLE